MVDKLLSLVKQGNIFERFMFSEKLNLSLNVPDEIKGIFLIGSSASEIKKLSPKEKMPSIYQNLFEATKAAFKAAKKNGKGSILLSPGCSSHDQFKNFEDRGNVFVKAIASLLDEEKNAENF